MAWRAIPMNTPRPLPRCAEQNSAGTSVAPRRIWITPVAAFSVVALAVALPAAAQQTDRDRRGEDTQYRDRDRGNDEFRDRDRNGVSQAELAAADRRLNQIYQRRVVEARAADRASSRRNDDDRYDRDREG